ncbi:MAG TPA: hypothetical protein VFB15_11730 [Candidatus Binataceae bacterium]|jgi:hypothetical protein|nr:hypothetical protein [Candidatus Binataceae bacterium]
MRRKYTYKNGTVIEAIDNSEVLVTRGDDQWRYWCPLHGGYVREVTPNAPGILGRQVCEGLSAEGSTLYASDPDAKPLIDLIRREYARGMERMRKRGY